MHSCLHCWTVNFQGVALASFWTRICLLEGSKLLLQCRDISGSRLWRMDQQKFFKSCLPQILLGPFLNTLPHLIVQNTIFPLQHSRKHLFFKLNHCYGKSSIVRIRQTAAVIKTEIRWAEHKITWIESRNFVKWRGIQ